MSFLSITPPTITESGVWLLVAQKPLKRPGWWKGKLLHFGCWQRGGVDFYLKGDPSLPNDHQWARAFTGGGRGYMKNSPVCSDGHLDAGHQWADLHHLYRFKYSSSLVLRSACSHLFEAGYQNCGSSLHGWASLVAQMVKQSACNAGDLGSFPGSGRSPGEGNSNPVQYSCLENRMDKGTWQGLSP